MVFEFIGDAWSFITEKVGEGFEEFIDLFRGLFSNLKEFSIPGLIAGVVLTFFLFISRGLFLDRFRVGLPTKILCYVATFIVGYLFMKKAFEQ